MGRICPFQLFMHIEQAYESLGGFRLLAGLNWHLMRILVVEEDKESGSFIQRGLSGEGFAVDVVDSGHDAFELAHHVAYDAIILNAFLPDMTSLSLVNLLRKERYPAVIFLLSPQAQEQGQLEAFSAGADDFLVKPSLPEMVARLHIHLRHLPTLDGATSNPTELVRGDLRMNLLSRRVECGGKEIQLTKKESELLEIFMRHPDQVFLRLRHHPEALEPGI